MPNAPQENIRVVRTVRVNKPSATSAPPKHHKWLYMSALVLILTVSGIVMVSLWNTVPSVSSLSISNVSFAAAVHSAPTDIKTSADAAAVQDALINSSNQVNAQIVSITKVLSNYE